MSAFDHLNNQIQKTLRKKGFSSTTSPQEKAIPEVIDGKNLLLVSPTGTGKTEAVVLPIFNLIKEKEEKAISSLYITPLRALNRDIVDRLKWWGKRLDIDVQVRHGDTGSTKRRKQAKNPPDLLVTTPETLQAILPGSRMIKHLSNVKHVVIDEIHDLAESKRGIQLSLGLERLTEAAGDFQRIGLSATVGNPNEISDFLTGERKCNVINSGASGSYDFSINMPDKDKTAVEEIQKKTMLDKKISSHIFEINELVKQNKSVLIFVNTREAAETLSSRFNLIDSNIGVHHGSLSKQKRIEIEKEFKEGKIDGLICTSSMELGIDIGDVDLVIQYNSPRQVFRLVQRVGRSGHENTETSRGQIITSTFDDILESITITSKAQNNSLEDIKVRENCFDVLSNQICGLNLNKDNLSFNGLYNIVTRAYPFLKLTEEKLRTVLSNMDEYNLIHYDEEEDIIHKIGRTWKYYYSNLSMIPDEKNYSVKDLTSGQTLASLDESFVASFAEEGAVFIAQGKMWKIITIQDDEIEVEEIKDPQGTIPNWVGEEIPVPYDVAIKVGKIRKNLTNKIDDIDYDNLLEEIDINKKALEKVFRLIKKQKDSEYPVPTNDRILIEKGNDEVIINSCFGLKVNKTIGQAITSLLTSKLGSTVGLEVDPYRIKLDLPKEITIRSLREVFPIKPNQLRSILELSLKNTSLFKWELVKVGKKFGSIDKDIDHSTFSIERLMEAYKDTPIYEEAMKEILNHKLDIERARQVLERIENKDIELVYLNEKTPIGKAGRKSSPDLISPDRADKSILDTLRNRLLNEKTLLFCLHCKDWNIKKRVKRVKDKPKCPKCNSKLIASLNPWEEDKITNINNLSKEELKRLHKNANMVLSHGKKSVIALSGNGIGPRAASRIFKNLPEDQEFYKKILEEERKYARTKMFWDET
ncbi:MAG: Lhr-like helicase with C-terminal Zn finger domain [Candidatus Methanohalarchaeum thermophilum]|uniref:Lhr-like helicase with C-terminal Zn finger domain n=1 Tax=Methanohalarchaeum thermophilum TaxID=1903181 RepID=A0A1Q6DXA3_METT1|nr:MAG: Lhr-like helicase with C-terminal Zn finger domain [Candidatus Methanohalarchaeum thermophilum]